MCVCVCVCMCVCVCVCVCFFVVFRSQNIGTNGFTATQEKNYYFFFAKNVSFRSYGIICLNYKLYLSPKDGYQRNQHKVEKTLVFAILTKYASFRS